MAGLSICARQWRPRNIGNANRTRTRRSAFAQASATDLGILGRAIERRMEASQSPQLVIIEHGDVRATILPTLGGSLGSLSWRGIDLLRAAPADCSDVRDKACFPLVPFANRIDDGQFSYEECDVELEHFSAELLHALHGTGWQSAWRTDMVERDRVELRHRHQGERWPWPFVATEVFQLLPWGIEIDLAGRCQTNGVAASGAQCRVDLEPNQQAHSNGSTYRPRSSG
ncbi:MAG: hypothetical protein ACTHJR_14295 [Sphingomonas sp.]|uniref:aldose epimerase family protein n=1 Tax=Sphingomonas sp. TaxID=28214 RepID=UPI003F81BB3A